MQLLPGTAKNAEELSNDYFNALPLVSSLV